MRKNIIIYMIMLLIVLFCSCSSENEPSTEKGVMNITEKLFVQQMNELYLNPDDYIGMTVKYEGIFAFDTKYKDDVADGFVYYVYRYGPGCCGYDANVGLEIEYEGDDYPEYDDWVEVSGILKEKEDEYGDKYVYLYADELNVLDERGAERVTN